MPSKNFQIELRGVRVNNLDGIDLDIPHGQFLMLCGLSGSGKSSLAFDTLYAEGQRRYIESLSPYTRQFLEQLPKPRADRIDHVPPAIAVRAARGTSGNRATVGTATEILEYLRLLFAKVSAPVCHECKLPVQVDDPQSVAAKLESLAEGVRYQVGFKIELDRNDPVQSDLILDSFLREGFSRVIFGEATREIRDLRSADIFTDSTKNFGWVIVDRLSAGVPVKRIRDSLETAFQFGDGQAWVFASSESEALGPLSGTLEQVDGRSWLSARFSRRLICNGCGHEFPKPSPQLFSFNSPIGACPECEGFGSIHRLDMNLIVPEPNKSIRDGAIAPWNTPAYEHECHELLALADDYDVPVDVPFSQLSDTQIQLIWDGVPERKFGGLSGFFRWLERRKYKLHIRVFLSRWRTYEKCPTCSGARLVPDALAFRIKDRNIADLCGMSVSELDSFWAEAGFLEKQQLVGERILRQIGNRLRFLSQVGLHYLVLDRTLKTLSGGESQRVALTSCLGSQLVNMLYVLDEPSDGLHAHDVGPLTEAIKSLHQRGNTVVVVDHEERMIRTANRVVEVGPEAGDSGGEIVFDGTFAELVETDTITGQYLARKRGEIGSDHTRRKPRGMLKLLGASGNNLQNIDVSFPLNCLCVVSGVSGSGKSSLVQDTLYGAICQRKNIQTKGTQGVEQLPFQDLIGDGQIDEVVLVDQSPIGRSPRSNPVTYVKAFDEIRKAFAETMEAKTRNMKAGHFSFNVDGGRCEKCQGDGVLSIDMQFLADIYMQCDDCRGTRYREEVLKVRYRGKNIHEVLNMTVREAFGFFRGKPKVQAKLKSLIDVGLEYIRLGQPATTLSSGECQRLKLALYLNASKKRTLFLLDEPTSGLHMRDIIRLVDCFDALLSVGHSLIMVEHSLQLMKYADWIIDLGPGASQEGGRVVAEGTPEQIAASEESVTGSYLKEAIAL